MILMLEIASSYPIDTQVSRVGRGFFGDANALQPTSGPPGSPPWKDHPPSTRLPNGSIYLSTDGSIYLSDIGICASSMVLRQAIAAPVVVGPMTATTLSLLSRRFRETTACEGSLWVSAMTN